MTKLTQCNKLNINSYVLSVKNLTEEEMLKEFDESNYCKGFQCQFCSGFREINSDFGICWLKNSEFKNRIIQEHFSCKKFEFEKNDEYDLDSINIDHNIYKKLIEKEKQLKEKGNKTKLKTITEQVILKGLPYI